MAFGLTPDISALIQFSFFQPIYFLDGTPIEMAFGLTPDISALIQFSFFQPIYFLDGTQPFPSSKELPGRFLGLADSAGDALT